MEEARKQRKVKVFAKSGALTFEEQVTPNNNPALGIDAAKVTGHSTIEGNSYDWKGKISFQLSHRELPGACAVICGFRTELELKNHGAERNKSIRLKKQEGGLHVVVSQGDKLTVSVPVSNSDLFFVRALALKQLAAAAEIDFREAIELLKLYTVER